MTNKENNIEKDKSGFSPRQRSAARLSAVQALYEIEISGAEIDPVVEDFLNKRWSQPVAGDDGNEMDLINPDSTFFADIVRGVSANRESLDDMINNALQKDWTLSRVEALLKCILRAGVFELTQHADIPKSVIINEYMDVANAFYTEGEPKMVNGVLDKLAKVLREPD